MRTTLATRIGLLALLALGCGDDDGGGAADAGPTADAPPGAADAPPGAPDGGAPPTPWLAGVTLAGAEFGEQNLPGVYDTDYIYPTPAEIDYFVGKGLNVFRIAFRWERLQRALYADLDATELARLDAVVDHAVAAGAYVIIDPHNFARYAGDVVGAGALPDAALADFWARVAAVYGGEPLVLFGLMNEPHTMPTEQWLSAANASIAAIRAAGAPNLILVPGNAWTGAWSWSESWYGTPNADVMLGVVDPMDNYALEVHQYLDADKSGTSPDCVSQTIGSERVAGFTAWLRANGRRAFLGEFAGADNATCAAAVDDLLDHLDASRDVWIGWAWWAAGPWWGNYMFTLEPEGGVDAPQLDWLLPHL